MGIGMGREALAVCSNKSMGTGITIWDLETGDRLLHIPSCASPPRGFLCLRDQFLVASQVPRQDAVGVGAIVTWSLQKPQLPLRSYPLERIGPISCTRGGAYLAGGAPSGNCYLWEVANGKLLKVWRAHHKSLCCTAFSHDDSLLISGSDDGTICVWSMICLLDMADNGSSPSLLHYSSEHRSSVTGLSSPSGSMNSIFVSSSIDATCKVWDLISGRLLHTEVYPSAITAIVLHPVEPLLIAGDVDGLMFAITFDILEDSCVVSEPPILLKGHNGPITAITFSRMGLISSSEDCSICIWDICKWMIIRRFDHQKGPATNLVVIPRSSLFPALNHQRFCDQSGVSLFDKYPHPANSLMKMMNLSFPHHSNAVSAIDFKSSKLLSQQILDLEQERTTVAMEMKVETSMAKKMWATRMTKHIMEMNKHLQSCLLDLMQCRLQWPVEIDSSIAKRKKKLKIESP